MELLKFFFTFIILTGGAHTFSEAQSENIPEFESLVSTGTLDIFGTIIETESINASIIINDNYTVKGIGSCTAFTLLTAVEPLLSIALCEGGSKYVFCGNKLNNCASSFKTKRSENSLSLIRDLGFGDDETRFLVEFHPNKIIYRIQGESCLIGYPHGCIIDGFSWIDSETYIYKF